MLGRNEKTAIGTTGNWASGWLQPVGPARHDAAHSSEQPNHGEDAGQDTTQIHRKSARWPAMAHVHPALNAFQAAVETVPPERNYYPFT
jgi:hypothetical protein